MKAISKTIYRWIFWGLLGCWTASSALAQSGKNISVRDLQQVMQQTGNEWRVVNFWATWCAPCVKELPDFEKARTKFEAKGVKFVYVSVDFQKDHFTKVLPFIKRKKLGGAVYHLDADEDDQWIDLIEPNWDGAIPITFIVNTEKKVRLFFPHEMTYAELDKKLTELLGQEAGR